MIPGTVISQNGHPVEKDTIAKRIEQLKIVIVATRFMTDGLMSLLARNGIGDNVKALNVNYLEAAVQYQDAERKKIVILEHGLVGDNLVRDIQSRYPKAKLLLICHKDAVIRLLEATSKEVSFLVMEDTEGDELPEAISYILEEGKRYISPRTAAEVANEYLETGSWKKRALSRLTSRQREVLTLMAQGYNNPEIAKRAFLGLKSVENHINAIYQELHLSSRNTCTNPRVCAVLMYLQEMGIDVGIIDNIV